ncbi:MAG: Wzy polymerase domain-containing protein [Burkholderiaceae bacterium]
MGAPSIQSKSAGAPILQAFSAITIVAMCGLAAYDYSRVRQIYLPPEQRTPALRANPIESLAQTATLHPNPIEFARLTITPLTPTNAAEQHAMAEQMLHFSPEPRVIERLIDSARLLGREDEVRRYQTRFKAAFPTDEAAWAARTDQPAAAASDPAR